MIEYLILIKFIVAILVVLILSIIAEIVSPKVAGFISGLPTGTLITLFFFGLEMGPQFASESAIFNLSGMLGMLAFILTYYKTSEAVKHYTVIVSSIVSTIAYLAVIGVLHVLRLSAIEAAIVLIISIPVFIHLFKDIKNTKIDEKRKMSISNLMLRSVMAATIIVSVISIGTIFGPSWAGLLSAFPTTLFPLLLITHINYDKKHALTIIKNVPQGLLGLIIYSLGVFYFYPVLGVYLGTIASYAMVLLYAVLYFIILKERSA